MAGDLESVKDVRNVDAAVVISLSGDIDLYHNQEVRRALLDVSAREPSRLVVNLDDVTYMDSSGVGTLVEVYRRLRRHGGHLHLCGMNDRVRSVFEVTKLDQFFSIHETEAEALSA